MFSEQFRVLTAPEPSGDTLRDLERARLIVEAMAKSGVVSQTITAVIDELRELRRERVSREFCVCAAILLDDGRVIRGHRHSDCVRTWAMWRSVEGRFHDYVVDPETQATGLREDQQGFLTSRGRFVNRTVAMQLQRAISDRAPKGHVLKGEELLSEDLY
jgi:hypothetical protein